MSLIDKADDPRLVAIGLLMDEACESETFEELDPFGERHGAWQRTMHAWSALEGLDRYVMAALTSEGDEIAVIAGAEKRSDTDLKSGPRFRRFDVGSIRIGGDNPALWPTADIKVLLKQAVGMAVGLQPVQLEDLHQLAS